MIELRLFAADVLRAPPSGQDSPELGAAWLAPVVRTGILSLDGCGQEWLTHPLYRINLYLNLHSFTATVESFYELYLL